MEERRGERCNHEGGGAPACPLPPSSLTSSQVGSHTTASQRASSRPDSPSALRLASRTWGDGRRVGRVLGLRATGASPSPWSSEAAQRSTVQRCTLADEDGEWARA